MTSPADRPDAWLVPPPWLADNDLDLDQLRARFQAAVESGKPPLILPPDPPMWCRWWEWPLVQLWWYRQYKRADRRAFRRECELIRWRHAWQDRQPSPAPNRRER